MDTGGNVRERGERMLLVLPVYSVSRNYRRGTSAALENRIIPYHSKSAKKLFGFISIKMPFEVFTCSFT